MGILWTTWTAANSLRTPGEKNSVDALLAENRKLAEFMT